ncbi:MAG: SocA family protein [Desulfamplus sp.]|nr:SocA family protein [Desulfamplus sp.]
MNRFKTSYDKTIEVIVWLAKKQPGIDVYHAAKVLFYADKMHINKYGRPVTGDVYIKMPYGPVPSGARDLITGSAWLSPKQTDKMKDSLIIDKDLNYQLTALRPPDTSYLSRSDITCLETSLNKYGHLSFDELYSLTHAEKCYCQTFSNEKIDYALFIDDDNPLRDEILDDLSESSEYIQV